MTRKLGWLEKIFITPSHHRVHRASNDKYLNKNYGDIFIIWDKLFGTFQVEEETPVYGLTSPLKSFSFICQHFITLLKAFMRRQSQMEYLLNSGLCLADRKYLTLMSEQS